MDTESKTKKYFKIIISKTAQNRVLALYYIESLRILSSKYVLGKRMAIRKDGIVINDDINEKLVNMTFTNETNQNHSIEEIYLAKLIYDNGFNFNTLKSSHVFDMTSKSVKHVYKYDEKKIYVLSNGLESEIDLEKAFILPNWHELREYLKVKGFKMEFHYDPFKDGYIKVGFMKPKFLTGTDNFIIESHGKTDLEALYKVLLELVKYENNPS